MCVYINSSNKWQQQNFQETFTLNRNQIKMPFKQETLWMYTHTHSTESKYKKMYGKIIKWMKNDSINETNVDACIVIFTTLWHDVKTLVSLSIWRLHSLLQSHIYVRTYVCMPCHAMHACSLTYSHLLTYSFCLLVCLFACFVGLFVFMLECNRSVGNSTLPLYSLPVSDN